MTTNGNPNNWTVSQISADAIDLFLEYRDRHGYDEERAKAAAVAEMIEGASVDVAAEMDDFDNAAQSGAMSERIKDERPDV